MGLAVLMVGSLTTKKSEAAIVNHTEGKASGWILITQRELGLAVLMAGNLTAKRFGLQ